ncbi:hypothetical protein [Streptomyces sp. BH105]|uniref:hypothetical protein n=1 Tax=Streptomyces sp. BH105 TaxID=3410408 RepID=UPI003CF29EA9
MFLVTINEADEIIAAPADLDSITPAAVDALFIALEFTWDDEREIFTRKSHGENPHDLAAETVLTLWAIGCAVLVPEPGEG